MGREIAKLSPTMGKAQLFINQGVMTRAQSVELYLEEVGELVSEGNHHRYAEQDTEELPEGVLPITCPA